MEVDKSHEVNQTSNELKTNAAEFEERITDFSEKNDSIDVNIGPSQTSDKVIYHFQVDSRFEMFLVY